MSLNNIELPGFLYVSLFKNHLVDLQRNSANANDPSAAKKIDFLGGNGKKIIFVGNDSVNKFLADEQMTFLNDLLNACRLTMADIAFINFSRVNYITYQDVISELGAQKILIFGLPSQSLDLPFAIPLFQIQKYHEQVFMLGPSLQEIQQSVPLKKQLWNCLQEIFNIQKRK